MRTETVVLTERLLQCCSSDPVNRFIGVTVNGIHFTMRHIRYG